MDDDDRVEPAAPRRSEQAYDESRRPMAAAVVATMVLTVLLPAGLHRPPLAAPPGVCQHR